MLLAYQTHMKQQLKKSGSAQELKQKENGMKEVKDDHVYSVIPAN